MVKKIIVKSGRFIDGEYFEKERKFDNWEAAYDYMSSQDNVYTFKVSLIRDKSK